ncbi:MAG: PaaI family thioesterase [Pseudomonadales bacterium]|nr:PaaI family thioesterase [Pseudomonadales bacterium]
MNIKFRLEDEVCRAEWQSSAAYMGYEGVTHGGIQFCLLDDVMANLLYLRGFTCVTAKADVRFRNPLGIGEKVELFGRLINRRGPLAIIEGQIQLAKDETLIAESTGHFMVKGRFRTSQSTTTD